MNLFESIPFHWDNKDYQIRILYDDSVINVAAFLNNRPINGFRYQIQIPKSCNAEKVLEKHPVPDLVEACKKDITENRWEVIGKVIGEVKN
jgi:hypothetical protein